MDLDGLPRTQIAALPTPLEPLPRLSTSLGVDLWVKRDDLTGLSFGGNKTRKLEFLVGSALAEGADMLLTMGAPQSNHCRQTAAAAAKFGLGCKLVLKGDRRPAETGNLLLDQLLGAEVIWAGAKEPGRELDKAFGAAQNQGRRPYLIPYGGSNQTGIAGYVAAMHELSKQDMGFDLIVFASSSGGTQAGLVLGAAQVGFRGRILGISVDRPAFELQEIVARLAAASAEFLGIETEVQSEQIEVDDRFLGGGYAVVGDRERQAILRFARTEGLLLDPVYTGRAAGGMLALIQEGAIPSDARVLFWHTGGTPALFAFSAQMAESESSSSKTST